MQIPEGEVTDTPARSFEITRIIGRKVVLKAQVHTGGRGKGGGIRFAKTPEEARTIAQQMIGTPFYLASSMKEATVKVVSLVKQKQIGPS